MFTHLIESSSNRWAWLRHPWVIAVSVVFHAVLFAGLFWAASAEEPRPEEEIDLDDITYVDVSDIPPPPDPEPETELEQPEPEPATPQPQQVAAAPMPPRAAPAEVTAPEQPAGFQELRPPQEVIGIPPEQARVEAVEAEDFGGRGEAGGVAGGQPAEQTGGTGQAGEEGGEGDVPSGGTYTANMVDQAVVLENRSEVARQMRNLYPTNLRNAGIGGRVTVQFVVDTNGRVEPGSIRVISADHPALAEQTERALSSFRFKPARKGNQNVRQLVRMPIEWQPES